MANRSRTLGIALAVLTAALPANSGAQTWTRRIVNGQEILERAGAGWSERAAKMQYGFYVETSWYAANQSVTAMQFSSPQWQASDRVDYVRDTNGDGVMDYGWQYFVGRGWMPWTPTELGSFKAAVDQERSRFIASAGTPQQVVYQMYVTRADRMYQAAAQMIRARSP
jgi:hypothetical protein